RISRRYSASWPAPMVRAMATPRTMTIRRAGRSQARLRPRAKISAKADQLLMSASDEDHMAQALQLARRGLGTTWPNPSVGAIVVAPSGEILGRGCTAPGGRPHAEAIALERAGRRCEGATLYVTLEPCAHQSGR